MEHPEPILLVDFIQLAQARGRTLREAVREAGAAVPPDRVFAHGVRLNVLEPSSNASIQWAGYACQPSEFTAQLGLGIVLALSALGSAIGIGIVAQAAAGAWAKEARDGLPLSFA